MPENPPNTASVLPKLFAFAAVLGFFFLLIWFYVTNVYQTRFFDTGSIVVAYQMARITYIPYLLWLQYALGAGVLFYLGKRAFPLHGSNHVIASCLMGTALWHISLFAVGMMGGLSYPVMLLMAGSVMIVSWKHLSGILCRLRLPNMASFTTSEKLLCVLIGMAALAFLLIKGTYPSGGHDFYNIYFPYYRAVIRDGSLGPNEVWFQYFYAKGTGLYFLSMILLDPLAIHLATTSLIIVAACMVFDVLNTQATRSKLLPLFGTFLYVAYYIYTPGNEFFAFSGGWGDLEKTHELNAVLLLAVIWLIKKIMVDSPSKSAQRLAYTTTLMLICATAVMITLQTAIIIGLLLVCTAIYSWFSCYKDSVFPLFLAAIATGVAAIIILCINYSQMGFFLDQWIIPTWPFIDWQKIVQQGASLELYLMWNTLSALQHFGEADTEFSSLTLAFASFRIFLWWPVLCIGIMLAGVSLCTQKRSLKPSALWVLLSIFLLIILVITWRIKSTHQLSFFRLSSFTYAPVLIWGLLLWRTASETLIRKAVHSFLLLLCGAGLLTCAAGIEKEIPHYFVTAHADWKHLINATFRYNTGQYSLRDATNDLQGRSKNLANPVPLQGTYPAFEKIYEILPYRTRIWNMNNLAYCMLPACKVEQQLTMITSPRWYDVATLPIEEGRKILQEEGLNYIFYSTSILEMRYADAKDTLSAFYPGLLPENIADVYGIAWTNGTDYLLTWKSNETQLLDAAFMTSWKRYHQKSIDVRKAYFSLSALAPYIKRMVHQRNLQHPLPIR